MNLRQPAQVDTSGAIVDQVPSMGVIEVVGQRPAPEPAAFPWWLVAALVALVLAGSRS